MASVQDRVPGVSADSKVAAEMNKTVYTFGGGATHDDVRARDKTITGGKGANLAEMASIGLPVPPGFTITTEDCVRYLREGADFSVGFNIGVGLRGEALEVDGREDFGVGSELG